MGYSHFRDFSVIISDTASEAVNINFGWLNFANTKGGSALQNTVFYNLQIQNGNIGLDIGNVLMGSELWIYNCTFIQKQLRKGTAAQLENYNALSDNFVNCRFSGWGSGVRLEKGDGNVLNSTFDNVGTGVFLGSQVGDAILVCNSAFNAACDNVAGTNNSSSRSTLVIDKVTMDHSDIRKAPGTTCRVVQWWCKTVIWAAGLLCLPAA